MAQDQAVLVPAQNAALFIPVAENDSPGYSVVDFDVVNGGAVRVAVQQDVDAVFADGFANLLSIDVHYFLVECCAARRALCSRMCCDRESLLQGFRKYHGLPLGVPGHRTSLLVFDVVGAECVAVAQQDLLAVKLGGAGIGEDRDAGFRREFVADHEIAIAVHEVDGHSVVHEISQGLLDRRVILVGIVIADPGLEEVAENIECLGILRLAFEEGVELIANFRAISLEVQV